LFHVQVGPFTDIKEAEGVRSKLVSDGYNPILKK
jgi:cell division protein FtsN